MADRRVAAAGEAGLDEAVGRAAVERIQVAVVALLAGGEVDVAVAAGREGAVGVAEDRVAGVVARFVGEGVGDAVAADRAGAVGVARFGSDAAGVALFERRVDDAVAARA